MIEAVMTFALLTALLELALLYKLKPRTRLRVLSHPDAITCVAFIINLVVHWGTMTGSMTAVTAALASVVVTSGARWYWGYIRNNRYYIVGVYRFKLTDLLP